MFSAPPCENSSSSVSPYQPYEVLVDAIQFARAQGLNAQADVLEDVVDVMVFGLYFEAELKNAGCYINKRVAEVAILEELSITGVMKLVIDLENEGVVTFALKNYRKIDVVRTIVGEE